MPVGVPKVLYYWDDELPLQWIDLYNLIFRRRLVFVMSELDQDLCNQIAGMMVYIHFEDKRKELEKKGVTAVDLFEQGDLGNNLSNVSETIKSQKSQNYSSTKNKNLNTKNLASEFHKISYEDLMDEDTIFDFWDFNNNFNNSNPIADNFLMNSQNNLETNNIRAVTKDNLPIPEFWNDFLENSKNVSSNNLEVFSQIKKFEYFINSQMKDRIQSNPVLFSSYLEQQSNFFKIYFAMLSDIQQQVQQKDRINSSKNFSLKFLEALNKKFNLNNKYQTNQLLLQPELQTQNILENSNKFSSKKIPAGRSSSAQKFLNLFSENLLQLQKSSGIFYWWNWQDKPSFKISLKAGHYRDFKDPKISSYHANINNSMKAMDESRMKSEKFLDLKNHRYFSWKSGLSQNYKNNSQNIANLPITSSSTLNNMKSPETSDIYSTQERIQEQRRVFVFINSTGGSVTSGMTIYDALQFVKAGAVTVCLGMAFSASSMVLAGGNIGHRYVAEGGHVMIHQPEGGITGQASDVLLDAHEIMRVRRQAALIYALSSKRSFHEVLKDMDRDFFMTPQEAIDYGLADEIVTRYNAECILDEFEKDWCADDVKQMEGISKKIQQLQDDENSPITGTDPRR